MKQKKSFEGWQPFPMAPGIAQSTRNSKRRQPSLVEDSTLMAGSLSQGIPTVRWGLALITAFESDLDGLKPVSGPVKQHEQHHIFFFAHFSEDVF